MMAFLNQLDGFYGTGEKNKSGQTLEEFLEAYNPKKYDAPTNTTDIVVVRSKERLTKWGQPLQILLVRRSNHPSIGFWATPGGFVELREDLEAGAARELEEETGVKGLPLQQLYTWGQWNRDPRWRVITTSFLALAEGSLPIKAGDDAAEALWMDVKLEQREADPDGGRQVWQLTLTNQACGAEAGAVVEVRWAAGQLLRQERYRLLSSCRLAVDHGCIITQALLYLRERLG